MSKGNTFENDWLKLLFNGTAITGIADNSGAPLSSLYVSLHTADPGEAGGQNTNEISYTGYNRMPVARDASGWVVTGNSVSPAANITFPPMTGGAGGVVTHVGIGTDLAGAGKLLYKGAVSPTVTVVFPVAARLTPASVITED